MIPVGGGFWGEKQKGARNSNFLQSDFNNDKCAIDGGEKNLDLSIENINNIYLGLGHKSLYLTCLPSLSPTWRVTSPKSLPSIPRPLFFPFFLYHI